MSNFSNKYITETSLMTKKKDYRNVDNPAYVFELARFYMNKFHYSCLAKV